MASMNVSLKNFDLFINGKIRPAQGNKYFDAVNPSTGEVIAKIADASTEDIHSAVGCAREAFVRSRHGWGLQDRAQALRGVAQLIREHAKELADLESVDTGKTIKQTTFIDIPTAADTFDFFAEQVSVLRDETPKNISTCRWVSRREPMGVVAAIIPWNYPLIMAAWKIAPALLAGNSVLLKPSPLASLSLMHLAALIAQSGLLEGMLSVVSSSRPEAGEELTRHPDIDMISFSGGVPTGQKVMQAAATPIKKIVLELGGKSANIVFADADMDAALGGSLTAIFMNQGQMCTAGSRLLVEDSLYDAFVARLVVRAKSLGIGNAGDFQTEFGPLIAREHRDKVVGFIEQGKREGAKLLCGGNIPMLDQSLARGFYLEPTVFGDVTNDMTIAREEIFGPVLCVMRFKGEEEAIRIANDSKFGLAAIVWTQDRSKADRVSGQLNCGTVWVNTYGAFYNEIPFGGWKQSGFGRELGREGIMEFTQSKQVIVDETPGGKPLAAAWF